MIGGGACAYNPESIAPFFDLFYIGEGETSFNAFFDAYRANKEAGGTKEDFLFRAAQIPGIYVPSFYDVAYKEDGTIASFMPNREGVPAKVQKQAVIDIEKEYRAIKAPVVPFIKSDTGQGYTGAPERLYPRLPFLSGRYDLPSGQRTEYRYFEGISERNAEKYRT